MSLAGGEDSERRLEEVERDERYGFFKWSPLVKILVLMVGTALSYTSAYFYGHVSIYLPFISETGAEIPDVFIFSLTLYFGSLIGVIVVLYQYMIMKFRISAQRIKLQNFNRTTSICGLVSMIGLAGVAAVPMSTILWLHLVFAAIHFTFAFVYANCMTFIIFFVPGGDTRLNRMRMALCIILLLLLISLLIMFPLSQFKWYKVNHHPPALKTPKDMFFELMLASTSLEWTAYAIFLTIMGSFYFELKNYQLVFGVEQVDGEVRPDDIPTVSGMTG